MWSDRLTPDCRCYTIQDEMVVCEFCTRKFIQRARKSLGMTPAETAGVALQPADQCAGPKPTQPPQAPPNAR